MLATSAPAFAVIDADLQHDASVLPRLFSAVAHEGNDLAVGTRYSEGGSTGDWDASREKISRLATWASGLVMKARLSDPMSGFFAIRRERSEEHTSELQSLMRISYAVFCLKKKTETRFTKHNTHY